MGTTEILARHIVETTYDALPADVVRAAKDIMLDGIGVMLAGSQEEPPRIAAEYAREMGGRPDCTVFGHGFKTSPPMAAFVNGGSGHVLDYQPMWHPATHATSPTLPATLAPRGDARGLRQGRDRRAGRGLRGAGAPTSRRLRYRAHRAHRVSSSGDGRAARRRGRRRGAPRPGRPADALGARPRRQPQRRARRQ